MIRVLLLADTHLGSRGGDFFSGYERALRPAFAGEVDLVVHGGDMFFRSRSNPDWSSARSSRSSALRTPACPSSSCPGIMSDPRFRIRSSPCIPASTSSIARERVRGIDVAVAGFPCERNGIEETFAARIEQSGWRSVRSALRLLCVHQTVEGAMVGPVGYVFRRHADVIPGRAIPSGFAAVLAGHIHRHQVLLADLSGRPLPAPVFYPGATERTSAAERNEVKGYVTMELAGNADGGRVHSWAFHGLSG